MTKEVLAFNKQALPGSYFLYYYILNLFKTRGGRFNSINSIQIDPKMIILEFHTNEPVFKQMGFSTVQLYFTYNSTSKNHAEVSGETRIKGLKLGIYIKTRELDALKPVNVGLHRVNPKYITLINEYCEKNNVPKRGLYFKIKNPRDAFIHKMLAKMWMEDKKSMIHELTHLMDYSWIAKSYLNTLYLLFKQPSHNVQETDYHNDPMEVRAWLYQEINLIIDDFANGKNIEYLRSFDDFYNLVKTKLSNWSQSETDPKNRRYADKVIKKVWILIKKKDLINTYKMIRKQELNLDQLRKIKI